VEPVIFVVWVSNEVAVFHLLASFVMGDCHAQVGALVVVFPCCKEVGCLGEWLGEHASGGSSVGVGAEDIGGVDAGVTK